MMCHFCKNEIHLWEDPIIFYSHRDHPEVREENEALCVHEAELKIEREDDVAHKSSKN